MIFNNLITAVMISMAVGGNTATAFNKEPQKATSEPSIILNGENTFDLAPNNVRKTTNDDGWTICYSEYTETNTPQNEIYCRSYWRYKENSGGHFRYEIAESITLIQFGLYMNYSAGNIIIDSYTNKLVINKTNSMNVQQDTTIRTYDEDAELYTILFRNGGPTTLAEFSSLRQEIMNTTYESTTSTTQAFSVDTGLTTNTFNNPTAFTTDTSNYYYGPVYIMIYQDIKTGDEWFSETTATNINYEVINAELSYYWERTAPITQEAVPIIPMLYSIITMPFTFFTTAFSFTLWAGTPYSVAIGDIILFVVGMLILVFIANVIIKFWK